MPDAMKEGITFSDVLLVPKRSTVASRKSVDISGRFSRNIKLKCPIVSANMDTVTEADMAIAMAQAGGLGVIHRFLTIAEEAAQVAKVKRTESVIIDEPYTVSPRDTVADARDLMRRKEVGGLLVVDGSGKLLGVVTERDIHFHEDGSTPIKSVMSTKLVTASPGITLERAQKVLAEHKIEKLPVVDAKGILRGLITAKDIKKKKLHPDASQDAKGRLLVGAAVGVVGDTVERSAALLEAGADCLVVDVAHGHADHVIEAVSKIKKRWPKAELVAGNVATYEGARDLVEAGADGVKVGVGPGSICSTRIVSGAGVPQLTAIMECAKVFAKSGVPVTADGGVRDPGDITKAMAGGASAVMIGSLLAGTEESPGLMLVRGGVKYKLYRGMASLTATLSRRITERGARPIDDEEALEVVPEGVESMVPYRGRASEVVHQLAGGLRSGMSYCGARTLPELWSKAEFIRITPAAWAESLPRLERRPPA
ncbi:MAG: IMP dehydrogenase [Elusimicrobia bacterium]|nr:IMP dehydrogenase [Elusimicrobiota bacterium]